MAKFVMQDGLPPDGASGTFIAFDAYNTPCLLQWAQESQWNEAQWYALGFEPQADEPFFRPVAFFGTAVKEGPRSIVRWFKLPESDATGAAAQGDDTKPASEPVAWSYELAGAMLNGEYCNYKPRLTHEKPDAPGIRNLVPLYARE